MVIKQRQQVRLEFNQQWLPMGISMGQSLSLSALSVRFLSGIIVSVVSCSALSSCLLDLRLSFLACLCCSICSVLSCCLLDLRLLFSSLSPGLLAIFLSSCALSRISERAPTILFCFNRIHDKVFCCSKI